MTVKTALFDRRCNMARSRTLASFFALTTWAVISPTAHAQQILQNFTGVSINDLPGLNGGSSFIPPDTQGAVGVNSLVEMVNGAYATYNTSGSRLQLTSLDSFWTNAGVALSGGTFDPRVVYDPFSQRYYAAALDRGTTDPNNTSTTQNNHILLAVSNTSDPTAGWKGISIAGSQGTDNYFVDYPTLGFNRDGVYVGVNNFPSADPDDDAPTGPGDPQNAGTQTVSLLAISKGNLAAQNAAGATFAYNQSADSTGFTAHPVVDQDNGTGTEYLLSSYNSTSGTDKISTFNNTAATPTFNTAGGFVTVTAFANPNPAAHQPGGDNTISTGDARFSGSVVKMNSQLWGVQTVNVNGRAGLFWTRIDAATGTVVSSGTIADATHDYYYGSIGVNAQGTAVISYTRSGDGASDFASSFASVGTYTGSSVNFGDPFLLKAGSANYDLTFGGPSNRWGDYSATMVDPNDSSKFWTVQEFASAPNVWSTQITEITPTPEPSAPATLSLGVVGLAGLITARRRRKQTHAT